MSQLPAKTMATSQLLVEMTTISQPLEGMTITVRSIDWILVKMVWNMLRSQENCHSQENRKA